MIHSPEVVTKQYDYSTLTTSELLDERGEVIADIPMIAAQLQDATRRPRSREDNSPEWESYREWRRRARWALAHRRKQLQDIKAELRKRTDTGPVGHNLKLTDEQRANAAQVEADRRETVRRAIASDGPDALLLRTLRVIRHVLEDGRELPDAVDAYDRETLTRLSLHLRSTYGNRTVKQYVSGEIAPTSA